MTTEPATKRRKVVAPKRTGAAAKKAAGPSKQDIKECKEGIAQWFPLTSDGDATFDSLKSIDTWRAYFKMRDLCPGMPLVVLEKGGEGDDDEEDDAEEAEAEETDENKAVKPSNVDAADAEPAAKTSDGAGSPDKKAPPVATKDADEAAAAPSVTEEEATVTAEAADDADDDDASASDGEDEEADEEEDDEEDEGAESEEEVDPLDGEDLLDEEEDALEKCMGFPAFEVADSIFDDAGEVVEHAAYALVDKISLRENRQNLQTCVRMYCLARPQAVDLKMNFHRKTRDDKPTELVFNLYYRLVKPEQVVNELPEGEEWQPIYLSYQAADGKLNRKLELTKAQADSVRESFFCGSTLEASGGVDDAKVPTSDLWKFLLTAVGTSATELVQEYSEPVLKSVTDVCSAETPQARVEGEYDDAGPDFDDPFDAVDYPPPEEGCAQQ